MSSDEKRASKDSLGTGGNEKNVAVLPSYDAETHQYDGQTNAFDQRQGEQLKRSLGARHVAMISIGGIIGTGLFLGTGKALASSGPVALFLGYCLMGTICAAIMFSLGEVCSYLPVPGGHIKLAERFVEPAFSAALGYNYWINWLLIYPAELCAASSLMGLWAPQVNPAVWVAVFFVPTVGINFLGVRAYGEAEFWFASIKVLTIIALIILAFFIDVGAVGPKALGFWYWSTPFKQFNGIPGTWGQFVAFWGVLIQAAFSFIGAEITAMAAAESANPRRNLPRAIRTVYFRILVFYILGTLAISVICDSNDPRLTGAKGAYASPFVIAIQNANIQVLPHIINAALITSATSAGSSDLYTSSRALYSLSIGGNAPRVFAKTLKNGLPWVSLLVSTLVGLLAFTVTSAGAYRIFNLLVNLTANAGLLSWACIAFTYIRFHAGVKAQGLDRSEFPYRAPLSGRIPFTGYWALFWSLICVFFSGFTFFLTGGWDLPGFLTNYLPVGLFPIIYAVFKLSRRSKVVAAQDMDFVTGLREIIDEEEPELPPKNIAEKIWRKLS